MRKKQTINTFSLGSKWSQMKFILTFNIKKVESEGYDKKNETFEILKKHFIKTF